MDILIIGKEDCDRCDNAKSFLTAKKTPYVYKSMPTEITVEDAYKVAGTMFRELPAVIVNGIYIGGFSALQKIINSKK